MAFTRKTPYRYNAERVDYIPGIADFQYLRARYYTPDTARFIQQDTVWGKIEVPLSQNLYAYCGNNPVNFVDPSGHKAKNSDSEDDDEDESEYYYFSAGLGADNFTRMYYGLVPFVGEMIHDGIAELNGVQYIDDKSVADVIEDTVGNADSFFKYTAISKWVSLCIFSP